MTKYLCQEIDGDKKTIFLGWLQTPLDNGNRLVQFMGVDSTSKRTLLDQIAEWTGTGWDETGWVPTPQTVPQRLLNLVENRLRRDGREPISATTHFITHEPMTYGLLLRTEYGWTNIIHGTEQTHFDSADECEAAAHKLGFQADNFRVVPSRIAEMHGSTLMISPATS